MITQVKEQTAFRFDKDLTIRMKMRAALQRKSVNQYVTELVEADLLSAEVFPSVDTTPGEDVLRYAGILPIPTEKEIAEDDRLARIWAK